MFASVCSLLAVSYEAREFGVKRGMRGEEATAKCPQINLVTVPTSTSREKADLTKYRNVSALVCVRVPGAHVVRSLFVMW